MLKLLGGTPLKAKRMFVHVIIIKLKTELVCCVWQLWVFPKAS
jgi:hypothetical protein